jgi:hypothetical protein
MCIKRIKHRIHGPSWVLLSPDPFSTLHNSELTVHQGVSVSTILHTLSRMVLGRVSAVDCGVQIVTTSGTLL